MSLTPELGLEYHVVGEGMSEPVVNENYNRIITVSPLEILDRDLTTPPGSPSNGDTYIVGTSATGDWSGEDGNIAAYFDGWLFIDLAGGMVGYVKDEKIWIAYSSQESAWHPIQDTWSTTEYWTGEYYASSKVYAKRVSVGSLPNATSSTDAHGISGLSSVLPGYPVGSADNGTNQIPLPYYNSSNGVELYVDDTNINLVTTNDMSGYTGNVYLKYTKT